jgi:hypothetical protein
MLVLPRCHSLLVSFSSKTQFVAILAVLLCLSALCPTSLHAQAASSTSIAGVVTDSSGAIVADAAVKLTDKATNTPRTTNTNDVGRYFFANVGSGEYEITASKTGFRITKTIVTATVGVPLTVDLKLELGSVSETIEVTATGTELQTLNATVGNTVTSDTLNSLPTIGRDSGTFVTLQPGVSPDGSVAGAVVDQSTFLLDGGQNTNDMDGSMQVYTPSFGGDPTGGVVSGQIGGAPTGVMPTPIDSIEEFKVSTTNQTADFNSSAGAQVQIVTRRGTNAWHGTAYEYYLDNNFNANTWDNNGTGTKLPSYHYSRFGGAGGGPIIPKTILGGKTYFFGNYEGFRWPNSSTVERAVPSANMRAGILTFGGVQYNLNTGTNCGSGGTSACDPRGIGINPLVQQMWAKYMPVANDPSCGNLFGSRCDGVNVQGFKGNMALPYRSDFAVARIDHDFGSKWHFTSSYRYYKLTRATNSQIDIGGFFPGDTLGTPASLSTRPQQPWYFVAGLTTNITSNTTNDFHFSYLRNFWSWGDKDGPAQFAGLGGALEPLGEQQFNVLAPYNVNTQSIRTRFWDGQDRFFRDDITMLKGNHLFTFGGAYQRNYDWHQRSDNGGGINYTPTYQLGDSIGGGNVDFSATNPGLSSSQSSKWARYSAAVLGIVTDSQIAYTRAGSNLALNPPLTHAFDQSTIPYYNVYFSDSWHMKPSFTFTYGLGWTLEMPPVEKNGKQIELVDQSGQQLDTMAYLNARKAAALQGQVYNPQVGFALVGNTGGGQKYPYQPYYGSFSPRIAAAWNPNITDGFLGKIFGGNKTVVRGGYSRVYGRLNGVDLVLVPLLGTGLIQPVQCRNVMMPTPGNPNGSCGGTITASNAFRVGTDGLVAPLPAASPTLPQPTFPGINDVSAAAGEALDPHFRPNVVDSFDLTIQRQLTNKVLLEVGYIGRRITHEYQPINLNAVPHMMTLGGQSFAKAYAALEQGLGCATSFNACGAAIPTNKDKAIQKAQQTAYANSFAPQPFFEAALANTGYCAGFSSCTAAVVFNESGNLTTQSVWNMWSDLDAGGIAGGPICSKPVCANPNGTTVTQNQQTTLPGFNFARSMLNSPINTSAFGSGGQMTSGVGLNASIGHGNYNAGFASLKVTNWHGLTFQENFTYSKALGTGAFVQATSQYTANDAFNLDQMYGVQNFDRKFVFNSYLVYEPPFYRSQQGFLGRVLGGWSIAPIFAAGSGAPLYCNTNTDGQSYGSADANGFFTNEQCHFTAPVSGATVHNTNGDLNVFANPAAVFDLARPPILGLDTRDSGVGPSRGLPYWNMDLKVGKELKIFERVSASFEVVFVNVFNHVQFYDPGCPSACGLDPTNPGGWGAITAQGNNPRQMQFGIRLKF